MHRIDYAIVLCYFLLMILIGLAHMKRAPSSVRSYFLGDNKIPWWITAFSWSMSPIDINNLMLAVSLFYFMGVRSFYHLFWVVSSVALACHLGRWIRRSNVVTAAEWMTTRFGEGWAGELPRLTMAIVAMGSLVGYIAYAYVGVGKFVSDFVPPLSPDPDTNAKIWGVLVISITAIYAILGGMFSVAYTDLIQTFILLMTSVYMSVTAFISLDAAFVAANTPVGWDMLWPVGRIDYMAGKAMAGYPAGAFEVFWPWVMMWVCFGILSFFSGPGMGSGMQFMLSTKSPRDTCKQVVVLQLLTFSRWTLVVAFTLLALSVPGIDISDTDTILPQMINILLPKGIKGMVLVGFLSAFMSTFSISINNGTSYIVRDIYTRHFRPNPSRREFIVVLYASAVVFIGIGIAIGSVMHSILELGVWVFSVLAGSMLVPLVLRWYWWRFNGWGFSFGMISAFLVGVSQKIIQGNYGYILPDYVFFFVMIATSLVVSVVVTLFSRPTNRETVMNFYRTIHPWGWWKPVHGWVVQKWPDHQREKMIHIDFFNLGVGAVFLFCFNMMPVYFMLHNWSVFIGLLAICTVVTIIMYHSWYKTLPD